jgi:S1-C subfamily serine protease
LDSGGSSGSPVLCLDGSAVALHAGGHSKYISSIMYRAQTDYFLPLDRVKVALEHIKIGNNVPRGTIQVIFGHAPYDEARRLGLPEETEAEFRTLFPNEIGMLVASIVVPKGPASSSMELGDILLSVNGHKLTTFIVLENILDGSVGNKVDLVFARGALELSCSITVQDLHSITPDRFVNFCSGTFNTISYQLARQVQSFLNAFSIDCQWRVCLCLGIPLSLNWLEVLRG